MPETVITETNDPVIALRLRADIKSALQQVGGKPFYLIEDPLSTQFFRLGVQEWRFAQALNGRARLSEALRASAGDAVTPPLNVQAAHALCQWLLTNGLVEHLGGTTAPHQTARPQAAWWNPFFIKIPLVAPDAALTRWLPRVGWLLTWPAFVAWLVLLVWAGAVLAENWDRFVGSAANYFEPGTWIWLWLSWIVLKVIHESFHGLVCKKYGGSVGNAGMILILFSPVAFVDVTSAWRFRSKWQRIFTSAAGMYVEFALAAGAAILWAGSEPGLLNQVCHSVVISASVSTLLFNGNPLMRFDGYYILADLLEIQNLYGSGRQYLNSLWRRIFFGLPTTLPEWPQRNSAIIKVYGVCSAFWRVMITLSLTLVASTLFHGAGLVIAAVGVITWYAMPLQRLMKLLISGGGTESPDRLRFVVASLVTCSLVVGILVLPWPTGLAAPAVVEYAPLAIVRASADGFVDQIHVIAGQAVEEGQILLSMRNEELTAQWHATRLELERAEIQARVHLQDQDLPSYQSELEKQTALKQRAESLEEKVAGLVVRAPIAGEILSSRVGDLADSYVKTGDVLLFIGDESRKEVQMSIAERHVESFSDRVGEPLRVSVNGQWGSLPACHLEKVEPTATVKLRHPALGAQLGGPLAIRQNEDAASGSDAALELVAPRFQGTVEVPASVARDLRAGQLATVRIWDANETIGRGVYRSISNWIRRKLTPRGGQT